MPRAQCNGSNGGIRKTQHFHRRKSVKSHYLNVLLTLTLLGFSTSILAAKPSRCDPWPQCKDDSGGGGGESETGYTVALTLGGFRFSAVEITPTNRGNGYKRSTLPLFMGRPETTNPPDEDIPWAPGDVGMWDELFEACYEVFEYEQIDDVDVSAGWGITQGGGKDPDFAKNIRIAFRDIVAEGFPDVKSGFVLYTMDEYDRAAFVPPEGVKSVYLLDSGYIQADDIANQRVCRPISISLPGEAILEICHKDKFGECE
jgi:hypothetical protein